MNNRIRIYRKRIYFFVALSIFCFSTFAVNLQDDGSNLEKMRNERFQRKVDSAKETVLSNIRSHFKVNEFNEALQNNDMIKYIVNFNIEFSKSLEIDNRNVKTTQNMSRISDKFWEGMMKFLDKNTFKIKREYAVSSLVLTMAFESQNNDLINYILTQKAGYKRKTLKNSESKNVFELIYGDYKTSKSQGDLFYDLNSLKRDAVSKKETAMIDRAIEFCEKEFRKLERENNIDKSRKRYYFKKTYTPPSSHSEFESEVTAFNLDYTRSIKMADLNEICVKFIEANHPYYVAFGRTLLSIASGNGGSIHLDYVYPIFINSVTPLNLYKYYYSARENKVY